MRIKNLKIEIRPLDSFVEETIRAFEDVQGGKGIAPREALIFPDVRTLRKVLSEKRLELLRTVKNKKPDSIYELAKLLDRPLRAVQHDVKVLSELGLIEVERTRRKPRDKVRPSVPYRRITIEIGI
ncbi:HVO_A0114 family putative DNA-binding protein [Thermodesulfatator autotrophicus]|uniref:HTH arsR-type domain-containing protein n=1 Tax=Thermodesulfatator autotrophicus TaxID=1795632 RepID=A0A177E8J6_9BACT|nr:helix-turn-helix domain-containing protein [Thermodesulfatator autotrophicus]OAG27542.1 hypothetical protein TH606_06545 [Thermodesulfatator autotrophicus]